VILAATGLRSEARIVARHGVRVIACGGHGVVLERALEAAIAERRPRALLSVGIAGALDPGLRVGDLVADGDEAWCAALIAEARPTPGPASPSLAPPRRGGVRGVDQPAASIEEKAALRATGAAAVDMESHIVARVAAAHNLPYAVFRIISDTASHTLPPAARVPLNEDGTVNLPAVLAALARNPAQLPALIRTARDANLALKTLLRRLDGLGPLLGCPYLG
jgi:adenosylhomocysteine nucleosidase